MNSYENSAQRERERERPGLREWGGAKEKMGGTARERQTQTDGDRAGMCERVKDRRADRQTETVVGAWIWKTKQ